MMLSVSMKGKSQTCRARYAALVVGTGYRDWLSVLIVEGIVALISSNGTPAQYAQ
jgi:hypothetical protein